MAAGKRKSWESLNRYRGRLRNEKRQLRVYLRGSVLWPGQWGTAVIKYINDIKCLTNGKQTIRA